MAKSSKPTLSKRFFAWLLPIIASFIVKRIMKRLGAPTRQSIPKKQGRKYVKNKAD